MKGEKMKTVSNKVKRLLAMLLSVAMAFDSVPATVIAAQDDRTEEGVINSESTEEAEAEETVIPEETPVIIENEEAGGVPVVDGNMYMVTIGREAFTTEKRVIDMVGGSAYYEPETNTLTLSANKGEKITGIIGGTDEVLISCGYEDVFTICGEAELSDPNIYCGIQANGDVVLDGDITINVIDVGITCAGNVVIDGDITVNTLYEGVFSGGSICVNGKLKATVSADEADEAFILYSDGKITINGKLEAEDANGCGAHIRGCSGIEVGGKNAYVHVKTASDNAILFSTTGNGELTLGENIFITDPAGGSISGNRIGTGDYSSYYYYVKDKAGNTVKEATIQYVPKTYTVSFNMSGKDATDVPVTQTVPENGYAAKPEKDPKAEGFDFAGWCADAECTKEFDFANTKISENKIVYAKWTEAVPEPEPEEPQKEPEKVTEDLTVLDKYPTSWNLFENADEHIFKLSGVSANKTVANSNEKSAKYYEATLTGSEIKVALKAGANLKKAAKAANTGLEFNLGEQGVVEYILPVQYVKPSFKLSMTSAPIVSGNATTVITRKASSGIFEPYDLSDAILSYTNGGTVSGNEAGVITIKDAKTGKGKIEISRPGWAEKISIKFTVKKAVDVYVDLGNLKTVVVNKNAPGQKQEFDLYAAGEVVIKDKKNTGLVTVSGDKVIVAYRDGVKKGTYTISLEIGKSRKNIKVKVSEKLLDNAVRLKVRGKYDVVTGQKMVLVPNFKEVSGKILAVSSNDASYIVSVNKAGNIVADYTGNDISLKTLKMKDMSLKLTIDGINTPVNVTVKKVKAKKTKLTVSAAPVTMPRGENGFVAVTNIVATYKDSAKIIHTIMHEKVTIDKATKCKAVIDPNDITQVLISDLSKKTTTVKLTVGFSCGLKKSVKVKVKEAK